MLSRREFLSQTAGATVTLILTPVALGACSSSSYDSGGNTAGSSNPTLPACDGVTATSTVVESHMHALCVAAAALTAPPAAGVTYTTSTTDGHVHEVTLSQAQLASIQAGQSVTVTTSLVDGHAHGFSIAKASTAAPPVGSPPGGSPPGGY